MALLPVALAWLIQACGGPSRPSTTPRPVAAPSGDQIVAGWMGSVLVGFVAWRAFDEPSGQHSRVRNDWGYTPRALNALTIGSYVGGTLGVWLRGRSNGSGGSLFATAIGVALPTIPMAMTHDDPGLPLKLVAAFAPIQGFVGYTAYRVSAPDFVIDSSGAPSIARRTVEPRKTDDVILAVELSKSSARNVYDAVAQLRAHWLTAARLRSPVEREAAGEAGVLIAYVEGARNGAVESLRQLATAGVVSIRYYNARDATTKFGTGHPAGAIEVSYSK